MNWTIILLLSSLTLQVYSQQLVLTNGGAQRRNVTRKVVRLDPILRKALLRALSELEREAQEKANEEAARNAREDATKTNEVDQQEEIQNTADTSYPTLSPTTPEDTTEPPATPPATVQDTFVYQTPASFEEEPNNATPAPTLPPHDIESNLIPEEEEKEPPAPLETTPEPEKEVKKVVDGTNVDIFKAPLVAAFTLHQDERGTPHSVIPLLRGSSQPRFPIHHQQFIPSVSINPLSHPQPPRFFNDFSSSTPFPSVVSNSLGSVVPSQSFHISSTVTPLHNLHQGFIPSSTPKPHKFNSVSIVPSNNFNFPSSTVSPFLSTTLTPPPQHFQPISIPPVTLPLQNEPRFQLPDQTQLFLQNRERLRNQFLVEEQTRQFEEQARQRQEEQRKLNEGQLRQQRQEQGVDFQRSVGFTFNQNQGLNQGLNQNLNQGLNQGLNQNQNQGLNQGLNQNLNQGLNQNLNQGLNQGLNQNLNQGLNQGLNQNLNQGLNQGLNQNLNQGLNQGFNQGLNQGLHQNVNQNQRPAFDFRIQPSQTFVSTVGFQDVESRNRVNRQEAFGSTGNFGFNDQRAFSSSTNQFQNNPFSSLQQPLEYRTIPEEHYRQAASIQQFQAAQVQQLPQQQPLQFQQPFRSNQQFVNRQLENLLYQSGVADVSGQEDLNIVSKVLALNHERSDSQSSERRSQEGLLVGEIKEVDSKAS